MIKYTYKDKELKVPVGIGNITNESFEEGFALGYEEGFALGYPSGVTAQKAKLISDDFKYNGTYEREDGWNEIEIDIQPACNNGSVEMDVIEQTFTSDDITPEGPDGEQLYFGSIAALKALFEEKGGFEIRVERWDDEAHSDYAEIGIIHVKDGVFYWRNTQSASTETAIDDIPNTWMQGDANGELFLRNDGYNLFMYETFPYGLWFKDGWGQEIPEEEMIFSTDFYAISAISVNAQAVYDDGYIDGHDDGFVEGHTSGVTDGFNIGYPSGHTDGYASGYENGNTDGFNIGYPSGVTDGYTSGYATGQVDGAAAEHNKIATSAISLSFSGNGEWQKSAGSDVFCNRVNVDINFGLVRNIEIDISGSNILISEPIGELGIQSQGNYYLTTANHDYEVGTRNTYLIRREGFQTSSLQVSNVNFKVKTSDFENWVNPSYSLYFNGHWNETSQAMYGGFRINIDRVSTSTDGDYTWIFLNIL